LLLVELCNLVAKYTYTVVNSNVPNNKGAGCITWPGKTLNLEGWLKIAYQSMAEPLSQVKSPK
jgi:hypothetical protein